MRPRLARFCSARSSSSSVVSARQRWSSSSSRSTAAAASAPRRASAARTASGSRRISLMSRTRRPPDAYFFWPTSSCRRRWSRSSSRSSRVVEVTAAAAVAVGGGIVPIGCEIAKRLADDLRRLAPGVLGDELRDRDRILADDDVLRHDRAGEAAVLNRVEHARHRALAANVEVRPVRDLTAAHVRGGAVRRGVGKRVTTGAALREQDRPAWVGSVFGTLDLLRAACGCEHRDPGRCTRYEEDLDRPAHAGRDHTEVRPGDDRSDDQTRFRQRSPTGAGHSTAGR